jgi:hypothetical protein
MAAALNDPPRSAAMLWTAARIDAAAGEPKRESVCSYRASALALDPHIGEYEPSLGVGCP